jgi:hypothetical protein
LLNLVPDYFDCDYNDEDLFIISEKTKNIVSENYLDYSTFLVDNITGHIKFFEFFEANFFDKNKFFKQDIFGKTTRRILVKERKNFKKTKNYFDYNQKVKEFKLALNNLWIKDYSEGRKLNHNFTQKKSIFTPYTRQIDLNNDELFEW